METPAAEVFTATSEKIPEESCVSVAIQIPAEVNPTTEKGDESMPIICETKETNVEKNDGVKSVTQEKAAAEKVDAGEMSDVSMTLQLEEDEETSNKEPENAPEEILAPVDELCTVPPEVEDPAPEVQDLAPTVGDPAPEVEETIPVVEGPAVVDTVEQEMSNIENEQSGDIVVHEMVEDQPEELSESTNPEEPVYEEGTVEHAHTEIVEQADTLSMPLDISNEEHVDVREEIVKGDSDKKSVPKSFRSKQVIENGKAIIEFDDASQESGTVVVVTTEEGGTKEILLRSSDVQGLEEGSLTVQQVTDENGQVYYVETMDVDVMEEEGIEEDQGDGVQVVEVHHEIPVNILGRNIENPAMDPLKNGKAPPKPRLGVKIPHRHLTSQIVSKQDIADEILERSWKCGKYPTVKQNIFAKKLTQTLAKKLAPTPKKGPSESSSKSGSSNRKSSTPAPKEKKLNNSDLIAILEGDGDPEPESEEEADVSQSPPKENPMTRELEREIALRQLRELPDDVPEPIKPVEAKPVKPQDPKPVEIKKNPNPDSPEKVQKHSEEPPNPKKKRKILDCPKGDGADDELPKNPRFSTNVPLKTYTRKRKPSDEAIHQEKNSVVTQVKSDTDSTKKIDLPANVNSYITKSSRIIKKKIIWDPDEVSPRKILKVDVPVKDKDKVNVLTVKNDKEISSTEKKSEKEKKETAKEDEKKNVVKVEVKRIEKPEQLKRLEGIKRVPSGTKIEIVKGGERKVLLKGKDIKSKIIGMKSPNDKLAALKFKRRLTEVDKLLMDEGAVNMLYSFKNTEEDQTKKKLNKSLVSKTNELLNDLQTNTEKVSPKALRKKESGTPVTLVKTPKKIGSPVPSSVTRQKSKDSNRSSGHSPPASPGPAFPAEASRIIRRHSSSSFSSLDEDDDEVLKLTKTKKMEMRANRKKVEMQAEISGMDEDEEEVEKVSKPKKVEVRVPKKKAEVTVESPKKKVKKDSDDQKEKKNEEMSKNFNKLIDVEPEHVPRYDKYKMLYVKKFDQLMEVVIKVNKDDDLYFNIEIMQELSSILKELETDGDCNMVLITSSGKKSFSKGTNFKVLLAQKEVTRKNIAKRLATNVRDFLLALANFPKVLVAGVHGKVVGLGVTMLPLFDLIISTESATFSTPYAQLGCMAEGGSLLALPHLSQNILVSELLYGSQVLKSDVALRLGLITRMMEDKDFQENLPCSLKEMSNQSAQFMEATKKQLRQRMIPDITATLNSETETLVQQWISPECQKNFAEKYSA